MQMGEEGSRGEMQSSMSGLKSWLVEAFLG